MRRFLLKHIFLPLRGRWLKGIGLLLLWTLSFIALPAISGWFLASCSLAFITANAAFSALTPSAGIRLLSIIRTVTRYFERIENHRSTLEAQRRLQLKIFKSVARLPYFKKQVNNNSSILENSTYGIDLILNHILLWILPLVSLVIALGIYFIFLKFFSLTIAIEFIISSTLLLFFIPQYILLKNKKLYAQLKLERELDNQYLIQSFRGRIEISKYNLEEKALAQQEKRRARIDQLEKKLQGNAFSLQTIVGFGMSTIAIFILWQSSVQSLDSALAIGLFFGIMAQAELSEMLFSGKSEKSSVTHQINDISAIIDQQETQVESQEESAFSSLHIQDLSATIPETNIITQAINLEIKKGDWVAIFGETGKGKTTFLNSLFYPEYQNSGNLKWNNSHNIQRLPIPQCIYVTQKAYLLTGTLKENFEGYAEADIVEAIKTVDLTSWYNALPKGISTWLGENGETLSGGQRKKLLLAQALLKRPQLLVVDEPTAGISTENALSIFQNIKAQYPQMSILISTHLRDFKEVVDFSWELA